MCSKCNCCRCRRETTDREDMENMRTRRVLVNDLDARSSNNCCCGCCCNCDDDATYDENTGRAGSTYDCDCDYERADARIADEAINYAERFNNCETCR